MKQIPSTPVAVVTALAARRRLLSSSAVGRSAAAAGAAAGAVALGATAEEEAEAEAGGGEGTVGTVAAGRDRLDSASDAEGEDEVLFEDPEGMILSGFLIKSSPTFPYTAKKLYFMYDVRTLDLDGDPRHTPRTPRRHPCTPRHYPCTPASLHPSPLSLHPCTPAPLATIPAPLHPCTPRHRPFPPDAFHGRGLRVQCASTSQRGTRISGRICRASLRASLGSGRCER